MKKGVSGTAADGKFNVRLPTQFNFMLNRTIAPAIVDAVNFNLQLQPYKKYVLRNGVEVYAIDAGAEEVLQVEWVFNAGNWFENKNLEAVLPIFC